MSEATETAEATEGGKTVVRPDTSEYTNARSASGSKSMHNGDPVAVALEGATLEEVYNLTGEVMEKTPAELKEKYGHLNDGMQRMNLGNRLRGVCNSMNRVNEGSGDTYISQMASGIRESVAGRARVLAAAAKVKEAEKAKAAKVKEAEKAVAEKAKAKAAAEKAKATEKAA